MSSLENLETTSIGLLQYVQKQRAHLNYHSYGDELEVIREGIQRSLTHSKARAFLKYCKSLIENCEVYWKARAEEARHNEDLDDDRKETIRGINELLNVFSVPLLDEIPKQERKKLKALLLRVRREMKNTLITLKIDPVKAREIADAPTSSDIEIHLVTDFDEPK